MMKLLNKKQNNKGFTLVELIIVIAIIAVLAAVLAPQYMRYVERGRQSNDIQVATSIMRATNAALSDPVIPAAATPGDVTVTWSKDGSLSVTAGTGANDEFVNYVLENVAEVMAGTYNAPSTGSTAGTATIKGYESNVGGLCIFTVDYQTGAIQWAAGSIPATDTEADWPDLMTDYGSGSKA